MIMTAVTITTSSGPLCLIGVRNIIVEEKVYGPFLGRSVLDEKEFAASQHLDSLRNKFQMHEYSHIGEEI
jgi:hypothetical protein